jgi:hypothetical protein
MLPWAAMALLLLIHHLIHRGFFPGPKGVGLDYSFFLPMMLDNYHWYLVNGWWTPPWFTPGFCGGQPAFPDPQSMYHSLPQLLVLAMDPLAAVYATMLASTAAGLVGMYQLLRRVFRCGAATALLGAGLFAGNGFSASSLLLGHLTFHGVMLAPWLALALLGSPDEPRAFGPRSLVAGVLGGLLSAYWISSGMAVMLPPTLVSVVGVAALHGSTGGSWRGFARRFALVGAVGIGLSLSKLSAVLAFMEVAPRDYYLLPGMDSPWQALRLAAIALFLSPPDIAPIASEHLVNNQLNLGRGAFELGVTPVPVVVALVALGASLRRVWRTRSMGAAGAAPARLGWIAVLALVLAVPVAVNTYTPEWNAFLKRLPLLGSVSNLFRWYYVYIPLVAAGTAIALERAALGRRARTGLALALLAAALAFHVASDREFYRAQPYQPDVIVAAWGDARTSQRLPPIRGIGVFTDVSGAEVEPLFRNDLVATGLSQLRCYNPAFGYALEKFPRKTLHRGSVFEVVDGRLNLKDPACYVFPAENGCSPGDHFPLARKADAERFSQYRTHAFVRSRRQLWADRVTRVAVALVPLLLLGAGGWAIRQRAARRGDPQVEPGRRPVGGPPRRRPRP